MTKKTITGLMRGLLAGTCLTAASAAYALTVNESTDFGNTLGTATVLPVGANIVNGSVGNTDTDFVEFTGLLAGDPFSISFLANSSGLLDFSIFQSSGTQIGTTAVDVGSHTFTGTIAGDGNLIAQVMHDEGTTYRINLTANLDPGSATPEPASAALAGVGLAAALLAARRKR